MVQSDVDGVFVYWSLPGLFMVINKLDKSSNWTQPGSSGNPGNVAVTNNRFTGWLSLVPITYSYAIVRTTVTKNPTPTTTADNTSIVNGDRHPDGQCVTTIANSVAIWASVMGPDAGKAIIGPPVP